MLTANKLVQRTLNTVKVANGVIWQPDPDNAPQCLAFELADIVDELGYGGQAGGGKTDLILGLAGTKFKRSLIIRREFLQLDNIIERGDAIYPANFMRGEHKSWRWGDISIKARSMPHPENWKKYQGNPVELFAVDEAAEFPEDAVRLVGAWTRSATGHKTLKLFTFNPPTTPEGEWIIDYFRPWLDPDYPNPAKPGEIRYFAYLKDAYGRENSVEVDSYEPFEHEGDIKYPISRTFIAASRYDNRYLDDNYERTLDNIPEPYRTMLKTGDMQIGSADQAWQLIPTAWIENAQARWALNRPSAQIRMTSLGVDVSRGGADETAIAALYGAWFDEVITYPGEQSPNGQTVRDQVTATHQYPAKIGVDVIGIGASAYDFLVANYLLEVYPINAASAGYGTDASGKLKFANLRARMYWKLREALDPNSGMNIALPPNKRLKRELAAPRYSIHKNVIRIEKKEDIKSRLGRSPDSSDAIAIAWEIRDYERNDQEINDVLSNYRGLTSG